MTSKRTGAITNYPDKSKFTGRINMCVCVCARVYRQLLGRNDDNVKVLIDTCAGSSDNMFHIPLIC